MTKKNQKQKKNPEKGFLHRFLRLNIATKMIIGYIPLGIVIILIAVSSLFSLNEVNTINESIVENDMKLIEATDKMADNLIAQESYGRRYIILGSKEMLDLFWKRSEEFEYYVDRIRNLPQGKSFPLNELIILHNDFNSLYINGLEYLISTSSPKAKEYDAKIKMKLDELLEIVRKMSLIVRQNQNLKMFKIGEIGEKAFKTTLILTILGLFFGLCASTLITRNISGSIHQLKIATKEISEGRFNHIPKVKDHGELGMLANAFAVMARRLSRMEEIYLDASPLTRMPGGIAIENVLKKRLETGKAVGFCLVDLDNFKAYNDHYGYSMGNEVIKETAGIIEASVAEFGEKNDFVGHIGGDDYAIVFNPENYKKICGSIVSTFDKKITAYYDADDIERGYIVGKSRQGDEQQFPLMTVSIAVVTNENRPNTNNIEIGEIAAELKDHAKSLPGSVYVSDRREETEMKSQHNMADTV